MFSLKWNSLGSWALLLCAVTVLVYARSIGNGFVDYDDAALIVRSDVSHGVSTQNIGRAFSSYDPELYVPLTFVGYQLDFAIAGLSPWIYHAHSVLLHALAAVCVMGCAWLLSGRKLWVSIVVGLLFALHPLQSEAVLWAAGRKDVQAGAFAWLSMLLYLFWRDRGGRALFWSSVVAFLFALLSKVSVIMLPIGLLLFDAVQARTFTRKTVTDKVPFAALSIIFGVVALFGKGGGGAALPVEKALIGAKATLFLLWKTFVPWGLSVLYPYTQPLSVANPELLISFLVVAVVTLASIVAVVRGRGLHVAAFGWLFFLVNLAPSFTNFAKGDELLPDVYVTSDRYAYVAAFGIFFAVASIVFRLSERYPKAVDATMGIVLAILALLTVRQATVWRDTESLFTHVLRHYPSAHTAHNNLGGVYYKQGRLGDAKREYERALQIRPSAVSHFNLGQVLSKEGNTNEAIAHFREAIELHPTRVDAYVNAGVLLLDRGAYDQAAATFEQAATFEPLNPLIHFNMGAAYEGLGRLEDAMESYGRALELDPGDTEAAKRIDRLRNPPRRTKAG